MPGFDRDFDLAATLVAFEGTLAFGRQVLWALFLVNAGLFFVFGEVHGLLGLLWVLAAMALAYGAQLCVTAHSPRLGALFQALSVLAAFLAGFQPLWMLRAWVP